MDKFVIIDGNNLMFRAFYALPQLSNFQGEVSNAVFGFANMVIKVIKELEPKYMAVAFDMSKDTFRRKKFPEYKGTRKPTPPEIISQFPIAKDMLHKMGIRVIELEDLEADDIIGCLSKRFKTENIIVSADRDTFQLISDNTSVMLPKKGITETIMITKDNLKEYYGVEPEQVVDLKSLMGDQSDNIPGVKGIGEKRAVDLINTYSTLDGVYENIDKINGKLKQNLIDSKEDAYLSQFLARIVTDRDLGYEIEDFEYKFPFDASVLEIFKRYQFNTLLKKDELFTADTFVKKIESEINIVKDENGLSQMLSSIEKNKKMAIYIDNNNFNIFVEQEYKVDLNYDLLSNGIQVDKVVSELKKYLEDDTIAKTVFDAKSIKHLFKKYGVEICGIKFDCLLARYLINSVAKPTVNIDEVITECGLGGYNYGQLLMEIQSYYTQRLEAMDLTKLYYDIELPLVEVLYEMELAGFKIDVTELDNLEKKYSAEIKEIENLIYETAGEKFNINSPKQLGEILFDKLGLECYNNKKKSTSIDILNELIDKHPIIQLIIRHRTISKLYSTYILGFQNILDKENKIHTIFNQTLTSTGRLSSSEPNLQNIPVRTEEGRMLRKVFIPSHKDGYILSADYSQIELRLLANFSGDDKLIDAYKKNIDIHSSTASEIFDINIEDVTPQLRREAKAINFGIIYGISDYGLSQSIGKSRKEASEYIKTYFLRYPKIEKYLQSNVNYCKEFGYVKTIYGRIRPVAEINSTNYNLRQFGERVAMNMPLQGSASDIIKLAMIKTYNSLVDNKLNSKIILQVHDELVIDVYPGELEIVKDILKDCMENVIDLEVKLTVNLESGKTWYDAK